MNRLVFFSFVLAAAAVSLSGQQAGSSAYQGVSNPPSNDAITTAAPEAAPAPPPPAGKPEAAVPVSAAPATPPAQPVSVPKPANESAAGSPLDGTDDGIVVIESRTTASVAREPVLSRRDDSGTQDTDIVHPEVVGPNELGAGVVIRVRLLDRLSTVTSESGEPFRSRVSSDVMQGDQVLIQAGAEIDGTVVGVSSGHAGGHGSMHLRPDTVILTDGSRFHLFAELSGAPGSKTRLGSEGVVLPDSRLKRDGIEYGGAVGAGATTGAVLGGPVGAVTGGLIGAGVVTTHLLLNHPQATLEAGTALLFTLTDRLNLVPVKAGGN